MELTNLIWHLAAALAAIWAALAYRALSARYGELRNSLLISVLLIHQRADGGANAASLAKRRSLRVRALRWLVEETFHIYGVRFRVENQEELLELKDAEWSRAISGVVGVLPSGASARLNESQAVELRWMDERGNSLDTRAVVRKFADCRARGQNVVLKWNAEGFAKEGGWQWVEV